MILKSRAFLLIVVCSLLFYSCKKGGPNNANPDKPSSIIGKWLLTKQTIRIYSASGTLVKDTTDAFGVVQAGVNSYQTFSKDGTSVNISNADTTEVNTYAISGNVLTVYPNGDHNLYNVYNIISVDDTNMKLESIVITSQLSTIWGLDTTGTYKLIYDYYFTRE